MRRHALVRRWTDTRQETHRIPKIDLTVEIVAAAVSAPDDQHKLYATVSVRSPCHHDPDKRHECKDHGDCDDLNVLSPLGPREPRKVRNINLVSFR